MKDITDSLNANTQRLWRRVQMKLKSMSKETPSNQGIEGLRTIMSSMSDEIIGFYSTFETVHPGLEATLQVMDTLLDIDNEEDLRKSLNNSTFQSDLTKAINEVDSVSSSWNYVKAGLKFIAALVVLYVCVPIVFVLGLFVGASIGSHIPIMNIPIMAAIVSVPTYYTLEAAKDFAKDGVNQVRYTRHAQDPQDPLYDPRRSIHGLFRQVKDSVASNESSSSNAAP